jgi:hypothetical protein
MSPRYEVPGLRNVLLARGMEYLVLSMFYESEVWST